MNNFFTPQQQASFDKKMLNNLIDSLTESSGKTREEIAPMAEELMGRARAAGKAAGEAAMKEERLCLYCLQPVENGVEHEYIKLMKSVPRKVKARLAYGFERDKDGFWMHSNVWQCILACQVAYGPLTLPEGQSDDEEISDSDTDNGQEN